MRLCVCFCVCFVCLSVVSVVCVANIFLQALELAQRGLQLSQELISVKTAVEDDAEEEQEQDLAKEEGNLANAALGAPSGPSAAWNMNYMVPGWLEEQKKKKEEEEKVRQCV